MVRMRIGESFFIPALDVTAIRKDVFTAAKLLQIKVETLTTVEDYIRGIRVWRVK